ncbi:hypothetical protein ScPMuIL_000990 [Solemya velum]
MCGILTQNLGVLIHILAVILSWFNPFSWLKWTPTSMTKLAQVEYRILQSLKNVVDSKFVSLPGTSNRIWTICANKTIKRTPLVLVHGMGGGVGLWAQNIDELATNRPLYAFDLLGFGRSSRPSFSKKPQIAEMEFVDSIEAWRKEMELEEFVLLGHSLGAYLAAAYAIRYPKRIKHLILVDAWGFAEKPVQSESDRRPPTWIRMVASIMKPFNPLAGLRAAGPWGPNLVKRFRPDLHEKFSDRFDDDTIFEYIYHCNAQHPSGETGFKSLTHSFGWAKNPMIHRASDLDKEIPMTLIYGSKSWVNSETGYQIKHIRSDKYVDVQVVRGAGHHVYADKPEPFNTLVTKICNKVDGIDQMSLASRRTQSVPNFRQSESKELKVPLQSPDPAQL